MSTKRNSPIKIQDYFINPLHRIKQPSFLETGFNDSHLNTFVKAFTNKSDPNYISIQAIRKFIESFTNGNPKLMQTYEDFFSKNFLIQNKSKVGECIELEHFLEFFLKQTQQDVEEFNENQWKRLFDQELSPLTANKLFERAEQLGIPMSCQQAKNIVKMINLECGFEVMSEISYQTFLKAMNF